MVKLSAGEALDAAAAAGKKKKRPRAKPYRDPAWRLSDHFNLQWEWAVQCNPSLASVRGPELVKEMRGYLRTSLLAPTAGRSYTEDEVETFIDEFMKAVIRGTVRMKTGQSAWRRFTGWWGRQPTMADPEGATGYFRQQQSRLTEPPPAT